MPRLLVLVVIASVFVLTSCNDDASNTSSTSMSVDIPADQIAATVNDTVISKDDIKQFKTLKGSPQIPDDKIEDFEDWGEAVYMRHINLSRADKKDVRFQLKLQESELLARLLMREKFGSISFSEDELKAAYDTQMSASESREFKARHILLKTEDEAKAVIDALRNGGDFIALAKERSTGPSGPNGGDLGWFESSRMVPPFAEAVKLMNKGDVSVAPVQTDFGFHVIKLDDTREIEKPSFESKRDELQQSLIREAINNYIQEVQDAATISKG